MQPTCRQVPPRNGSFSTTTVFRPSSPARMAATYPPGPLPIIATSYFATRSLLPQWPEPVTRAANVQGHRGHTRKNRGNRAEKDGAPDGEKPPVPERGPDGSVPANMKF